MKKMDKLVLDMKKKIDDMDNYLCKNDQLNEIAFAQSIELIR